MPIVKYSEASSNLNARSEGAVAALDTDTGHIFDAKGNPIGRWTPADDDRTGQLADYAHAHMTRLSAAAIQRSDPDGARSMLMSLSESDGSAAHLLDLGPSDVHIPSAMPNFASGYKNFTPLADAILPPLLVDKQVDDYWQFAKEDAFQRAVPTVGGGGEVAEITPRLANDQYSCVERAIGGWVKTQTAANADAPLKIEQATTRRCMDVQLLEREIRAQSTLRTTTNWNSAQVSTIVAGFQWNGGASSDPVKDLHTLIEASYGEITGIEMPEKVFHSFQRNPAVRAYYAFKSGTAPMPTSSEFSAILELPPIYVTKMKYINASGTLDYVWGTDVVLFRQPPQLPPTTQDDVATAYTFRWNVANPKDGVSSGGVILRKFWVQHRDSYGGLKIVTIINDAEKFTSKYIGGIIVNAWQ